MIGVAKESKKAEPQVIGDMQSHGDGKEVMKAAERESAAVVGGSAIAKAKEIGGEGKESLGSGATSETSAPSGIKYGYE